MAPSHSPSVLRYVVAGGIAKGLTVLLIGTIVAYAEKEPINLSTPVTIAAAAVGVLWFARQQNCPMTGGQLLRFSTGMTIVDILMTFAWAISAILMAGEPFSLQGLDTALFDGDGLILRSDVQVAMLSAMLFAIPETFGLSYGVAWMLTRKLPKAG